jgi:CheY-like chemotaxis protein
MRNYGHYTHIERLEAFDLSLECPMSNGRVLVVDDDAHIRSTVRLVLQRAGYEVLVASNGQEAIALLAQSDSANSLNTVLCDLDMPNINGGELISHIHSQYPHIPIVVLSGATDEDYLDAIVRQGVSDWLRKPATNTDLIEKIRVAVRLNRLRKKSAD